MGLRSGAHASLSPSEAQRFSQLLLIPRVYRSRAMLCNIGVRPDAWCPRCSLDNAHITHMFWECVALGGYREEVLEVIHLVTMSGYPGPRDMHLIAG